MAARTSLHTCTFLRFETERFVGDRFSGDRVEIRVHEPLCVLRSAARATGKGGAPTRMPDDDQDEGRRVVVCPLMPDRHRTDEYREEAATACAEFLAPRWLVSHLVDEGALVIGPGWLQEWREEGKGGPIGPLLGFGGKPATALCLLDTLTNPADTEFLGTAAERLGIPSFRIPVGLEWFEARLGELFRSALATPYSQDGPLDADYAMALNLLGRLNYMQSEAKVTERILAIFALVFAPAELRLIRLAAGRPTTILAQDGHTEPADERTSALCASADGSSAPFESDDGMVVPLDVGEERIGLIVLRGFSRPERRGDYRGLMEAIAPVCALSISNARGLDELKRLNAAALEAKQAELVEALAFRDRILSIIGHDLRAPMGSMVLLLEDAVGAISDRLDESEARLLAEIHAAAAKSYELLQNLLAWSRTRNPGFVPQVRELELAPLVEETFGLLQGQALLKRIGLRCLVPRDFIVRADSDSLQAAIRNLVSNALKFTRQGGNIAVDARLYDSRCRIEVRDEGIGMSRERLERARSFAIGRSSEGTEGERGSGLGLALVRDLVRRMRGRVEIESEEGRGTRVVIDLPAG